MYHSIARRFAYIPLWLGTAGSLMAQGPAPKLPPTQWISFYMVGGQEMMGEFSQPDKPAQFKFFTANGVQDLTLVPGQPTQAFARAPESTVMIYLEQAAAQPGKPAVIVPLAETKVSPKTPRILVLLNLDEATGKITLQPIKQGFKALPPSSVSFFNQTRKPLTVKIGTSEATVEPRQHAVLPIGLTGDAAAMVRIQVAANVDGKMQLVSSGSYALSPQDRRIILLAPGKSSRIRMTLMDSVPAEADEAEEPAATH
jgi:hypothetical protein